MGRGHNVEYWAKFLQVLERIDPDMAVKHEDQELDQLEGLRHAAETHVRQRSCDALSAIARGFGFAARSAGDELCRRAVGKPTVEDHHIHLWQA